MTVASGFLRHGSLSGRTESKGGANGDPSPGGLEADRKRRPSPPLHTLPISSNTEIDAAALIEALTCPLRSR